MLNIHIQLGTPYDSKTNINCPIVFTGYPYFDCCARVHIIFQNLIGQNAGLIVIGCPVDHHLLVTIIHSFNFYPAAVLWQKCPYIKCRLMVTVVIKGFARFGRRQTLFPDVYRDRLFRRIVILTLRQVRPDLCRSRFQNRHSAIFRNSYHTFPVRQLILNIRLCMVCRHAESECVIPIGFGNAVCTGKHRIRPFHGQRTIFGKIARFVLVSNCYNILCTCAVYPKFIVADSRGCRRICHQCETV